jgi:hypothetical protein
LRDPRPEWFDDPTLGHRRWLEVKGGDHLVIVIAASDQLAEAIVASMLRCETDELQDGDVDDALGEFLNLVVGSAKNKASGDGDQTRPTPTLSDDFPSEGYALYLVTNLGPGCVVFQTCFPANRRTLFNPSDTPNYTPNDNNSRSARARRS